MQVPARQLQKPRSCSSSPFPPIRRLIAPGHVHAPAPLSACEWVPVAPVYAYSHHFTFLISGLTNIRRIDARKYVENVSALRHFPRTSRWSLPSRFATNGKHACQPCCLLSCKKAYRIMFICFMSRTSSAHGLVPEVLVELYYRSAGAGECPL